MTPPHIGFKRLIDVLNRLRIPYLVGGSLASSIHGIVRATQDIDLVADVETAQIEPLVEGLGPEFYADPTMIQESLEAGRPFNLIHRIRAGTEISRCNSGRHHSGEARVVPVGERSIGAAME